MRTILDSIVERKKEEVEKLKSSGIKFNDPGVSHRSLIQRMKETNSITLIAEFKRASPSRGDINVFLDPARQASIYADEGASAISVLTDQSGFKGSFEDLEKVRDAVDLPILCKDFIIDEIQIDQARGSGADVILLIASILEKEKLKDLYRYAVSFGLECLIEVHDENDLDKALELQAPLIGVNNRNLKTFEVDLENTVKLGQLVKKAGRLFISESGIKSSMDVHQVATAGADGILVGESLMTSLNVGELIQSFTMPGGSNLEG